MAASRVEILQLIWKEKVSNFLLLTKLTAEENEIVDELKAYAKHWYLCQKHAVNPTRETTLFKREQFFYLHYCVEILFTSWQSDLVRFTSSVGPERLNDALPTGSNFYLLW